MKNKLNWPVKSIVGMTGAQVSPLMYLFSFAEVLKLQNTGANPSSLVRGFVMGIT